MTMFRALLMVVAAAALSGACAAEPEDPLAVRTRDLAAERVHFWLTDFTLGNGLTKQGRVAMPDGTIGLRPGDTIYFAMDVGKEAPPGASVEVVWHDPRGQAIHRETKQLQPGQEYVYFEGPETREWMTERPYRIDVVANGQVVNQTEFELEEPETPVAPKLEVSPDTTGTVGVDDEAAGSGEAGQTKAQTPR